MSARSTSQPRPLEGAPDTNWGRWGADDERGAANTVTPEIVRGAASLVREGRAYPLGLPIGGKHAPPSPVHAEPAHYMTIDGGDYAAGVHLPDGFQVADDVLVTPCHSGSHIDALGHVWYDDELYNGHSGNQVRSYGAVRCGVDKLLWLATRGVLLDLPAARGEEHLPKDHVIGAEELERCAEGAGVSVSSGDCVLVRTGWQRVFRAGDSETYLAQSPGIGMEAARWLAGRDVAAVGSDNVAVEPRLPGDLYEGGARAPRVHNFLLRDCGIYLMEMLDLDGLAVDAVVTCFLVVAPLRIVGGTASPVNPIAFT